MTNLIQEFQVVILPGGAGRRMFPLIEDTPKCLLPVANRPLLSYQLELLERVGFKEVIVVTREPGSERVLKYVTELYKGKLSIDLVIVKDYMGGAESLVHIKSKIKRDFITIADDLIVDGSFVHHMTDIHRSKDAAVTVLLKERPPIKESVVQPQVHIRDCIGLDPLKQRLLYFTSLSAENESIKIPKSLLRKFPNMTLYTNFFDPHFYILSHWTLEVLEKHKGHMSSLKGDLIPFLIKCQYKKRPLKDILVSTRQTEALKMTSADVELNESIRCFVHCVKNDVYCERANTTSSYIDVNRDIATGTKCYIPLEPEVNKSYISPSAKIDPKTQVGTECVVGEGTSIGAKCSIKKSIIGRHCNIGNNVKIINSVIMDYVTIKDGAKVQASIVCNNAYVNVNATLVDSKVGAFYQVPPNSTVKRESLTIKQEE
jgi:translation initiation factor eIF-2B subunit gamma